MKQKLENITATGFVPIFINTLVFGLRERKENGFLEETRFLTNLKKTLTF